MQGSTYLLAGIHCHYHFDVHIFVLVVYKTNVMLNSVAYSSVCVAHYSNVKVPAGIHVEGMPSDIYINISTYGSAPAFLGHLKKKNQN